jgi:RNA polymerase sigma-70 factor (ECF subfamily)
MAGLGRGESACLAELMRRHWRPVVGYAAQIDPDNAEDIAQETFLRARAHAALWRPLGSVRSYLLQIARNLALNERRRQRNFRAALSAAPRRSFRSEATPSELLEESEIRAAIQRAVDAMPERRREAFALVRFGGLSYRDSASVMGTSAQTIANHVSAALADIRRAIEPFADQ